MAGSLPNDPSFQTGTVASRLTFRLAAVAMIMLGLHFGRPLLMPALLAMLLAILVHPVVASLRARRVPDIIAVLAGQLVATLPVLFLALLFAATAPGIMKRLPEYQTLVAQSAHQALEAVASILGNIADRETLEENLRTKVLPQVLESGAHILRGGVEALGSGIGALFMMLLINLFILLEGAAIRARIVEAYGTSNAITSSLDGIGRDVRAYVLAKTMLSALTALCVWGVLAALHVDFALFWGLLAFPLNFIPTVGAILASVPPMVIALIQPELSLTQGLWVVGALIAINGVIGSFLDPKFVGSAVKLSALVVFLSMALWFLIWGPFGAILAVPIMVSVKVICSHVRGLERVAVLLSG